jgi:serine/threonine protein kinase
MNQPDGPPKRGIPPLPGTPVDAGQVPTSDAEATLDTVSSATAGGKRKTTEIQAIGPYQLVRKLGGGGMGQVWLAEQTAPVKRQVALKLIRVGMYDDAMVQRFLGEQQSLAVMNHPAIAKVFDAGSTPDGQPYFVMECVDGPSITKYCDTKKLKIRERLELFIKVCEGVQHAHQKAIIHRDLKPSNVLVSEVDGKPLPRIIDFGIAKAISSKPSADQTMFTQIGAMVGTPGFMSPEQADPSVLDVDTRTDVYSLGVILYALLTGMLPFDTEHWTKRPIDQVLRQLRQEDPPSPSTKLDPGTKTSTAIAELRGTEPKQLASLLHGDLDAITLKAVERDRTRRYGTPSELAADIQRYLHNEPVLAQPASVSYRLQKYVRRHRVGVSVAAGLMLLLAGFVVLQAMQLRRITRERDRANGITDFMTRMFKVSDPSEARGNTITAREILDKSSQEIDKSLESDPELRGRMMYVMGTVYQNLGLYPKAQSLLERAVEIQRPILGPGHPETLGSMNTLAGCLEQEGRLPEAEKLARQTIATGRQTLGTKNANTLKSMNTLAIILTEEGRYPEAEKLARETVDIARSLLGPEHPDSIKYLISLASVENGLGHYPEAEKLLREALEVQQRVVGPEHPDTLLLMNNLAVILDDSGRWAESEKIERELLDIERRILGPEHPDTLRTMDNLANSLSELGRYAEAEKLERETIDLRTRLSGPDHPMTAGAVYNLACILAREGRRDEAISFLGQSFEHGLPLKTALGIESDSDLKSLHGDPRFDAIVTRAKEHAAAQEPQAAQAKH